MHAMSGLALGTVKNFDYNIENIINFVFILRKLQ